MNRSTLFIAAAFLGVVPLFGQTADTRSIREECLKTLPVLTEALLRMQIVERTNKDHGGLVCPETKDLHTRAAEAVYPFAVMFKHTKDNRYLRASIALGNWLIRQQAAEGEWPETPWAWTGTTADQLLMMSLTYPILESYLTKTERAAWKLSIERAAAYLVKYMSPDFATINYCATTPATLAVTNGVFPHPTYLPKAHILARQVLSKMNADGFIEGEAARVGNVKYGVDPGYEFDMSFWGLMIYARISKDTLVESEVRKAVDHHLPFMYPNGMIDASWGARCYKWTMYGSKTADGSQILFSLLAGDDARYRTAALRNLELLRTMIRDGVIGTGPQSFEMAHVSTCNYPTFARAKNLAMAIELGDQTSGPLAMLPSDQPGFFMFYPSVNIAVVRTEDIMTTISGYHYVDQMNWGEGRYSQFPSGGSPCNVWVKDYGLLQTSSPTRYVRGEVIHMPEIAEPIKPHTPRIEFADTGGYYTNLYERFGTMIAQRSQDGAVLVRYAGELRNERHLPGGVSYTWSHRITDRGIIRAVELKYHDRQPQVDIVEPFIEESDMEVVAEGDRTVRLRSKGKEFTLRITYGNVKVLLGKDKELQWQPFPAVRCYPVVLRIEPPVRPFENDNFIRRVEYEITQ